MPSTVSWEFAALTPNSMPSGEDTLDDKQQTLLLNNLNKNPTEANDQLEQRADWVSTP